MMHFGEAMAAMNDGKRVCRRGWNGRGMWLMMVTQYRVDHVPQLGLELLPWIGMKTADNCFVPWLASQTDMQADDWVEVNGKD